MEQTSSEKPLKGRIAVVAGATRGAGRGIAVMLGEAGATVYVTGRSTRSLRSDMDRPETIEDTAEQVTAAGGLGIPVKVDHTAADEVRALFERIRREQNGRLDLLVNDVWGGDPLTQWGAKFWEHSLDDGLTMQQRAVQSHRAVAALAADPNVAAMSGQALSTWQLYREYGFTDADGSQPDWGAYFEKHVLGAAPEEQA